MSEGKTPAISPPSPPSAEPSDSKSRTRPAKLIERSGAVQEQAIRPGVLVGGSRKLFGPAKESLNAGVGRIGDAY